MTSIRESLAELVAALDATNWSSWQTTARFWPALENARAALEAAGEPRPPEPQGHAADEIGKALDRAFIKGGEYIIAKLKQGHPTERAGEAVQRAADADLLPCPFCGGPAERFDDDLCAGNVVIECVWCDAARTSGRECAAEGWNRRSPAASGNTATARSDETTTGAGVRGEPKQPEPLTNTHRIAASIGLGVFPEKCSDDETREWFAAKDRQYGPAEALRDLRAIEAMQGGRNGPSIKLHAYLERLYTHPQGSRKPLTDEQIAEIIEEAWASAEHETKIGNEAAETEWTRFGRKCIERALTHPQGSGEPDAC